VSLQLDEETSQLERRMLDAHMARCEDCQTYTADVAVFTNLLRAAPLEPLERPIVVARTRRAAVGLSHLGVAAGVAIVAIGSMLQVGLPGAESSTRQPTEFPTLAEGASEMQLAHADRLAFSRHRSGSTAVI
jgi:predicted anti-sigma-YlaC factor YlaD